MPELMSNTRITGIFDTVDSIVEKCFEDNSDRYKQYFNDVLRADSDIDSRNFLMKSYRQKFPEIDVRTELYRLKKNGLDDKELNILQKYVEEKQKSKEESLRRQYSSKTETAEKFEKAKKSRYLLANIAVFAVGATAFTAGISYLAQKYNIEMLNYSTIPLFVGSFIATVPLVLENWNHKVGDLLLPEYRNYMSSGTETHNQYLRERYSGKMQKYFERNGISMN